MPFEIIPFTQDMLAHAGALLATRHAADRTALPLLPAQFQDAEVATAAVANAWNRPHASGVVAISNGQLLGYLLGDMVFDSTWGRAAWVRLPGHALARGQSVELMRDLYAALAERWVRYGCHAHFALVSTADPALLDAWFRLSFGVEQMHALLDLTTVALPDTESRFTLRQVAPNDGPILSLFADMIWRQQVSPPTWAFTSPERADELPALYAVEASDEEGVTWLAFDGEKPVGFQSFYPLPEGADTLFTPPRCVELATAATRAEARGMGVGTALTRHGFAWAKREGYQVVETDWRSANLLSSRFWPKLGFQPVVYRLVRRLDPRIAFAAW